MKRYLVVLIITFTVNQPVWSASRTVVLAIPGMNCAACPITLKIALSRVAGVIETKVNFDKRQAVVIFDDAKTGIERLLQATGDAGYPSTVKEFIQ